MKVTTMTHDPAPRHPALALVAITIAIVAAGILLAPATAAHAQDPADPPMSDAEALRLAEQLEDQIVAVVRKVRPAYVRMGGGSGVIISPDGYVVTNHHVVGKEDFKATIADGRTFDAVNIGQDQRGDICLLKLKTDTPLPYVEIGDSDKVQIGDRVIALGNPFMYAAEDAKPTVTMGVVSALHRFQQGYSDCIMTDTRINPGNSGGPLLSMEGKLLGINGRIATRRTFGHRINTGVGYAVPVNQIMRWVHIWRQRGGEIRHGVIEGLDVAKTPTGGQGAIVSVVGVDTEAQRSGFRTGDLIVAINDLPVYSFNRYWGIVGTYPAYDTIMVRVMRTGTPVELSVVLAPTRTLNQGVMLPEPPSPGQPWAQPTLPPTQTPPRAAPGTGFLGVTFDKSVDLTLNGCKVYRVLPDTAAERAGVKVGDVILTIDGMGCATIDALKQVVQRKAAGDEIAIKLRRGAREMEVTAKLSPRPN
ncbi:MAG: trypsin-like peptidase domain-containing protein [Planctomycetota bacterium]